MIVTRLTLNLRKAAGQAQMERDEAGLTALLDGRAIQITHVQR